MTVARVTEIVSSSSVSFDDAISAGIKRAGTTLDNIKGAWVQDQKVVVDDGAITDTLKVTFVLND